MLTRHLQNASITALLLLVIALSWSESLDQAARDRIDVSFKKAIATYAVARSLNAVISVAQGTELAVQPVGIGVSLSVGQILDPLNDLIERFSWLVLLALASLGSQLLMMELFAHVWMNVALTLAGLGAIACLLLRERFPGLRGVARTRVGAHFRAVCVRGHGSGERRDQRGVAARAPGRRR